MSRGTIILLFMTALIFGSRVFASPASSKALAVGQFLGKANDPVSVTGAILEGIRAKRQTEFQPAASVIASPLKASDLQVVTVEFEEFPGETVNGVRSPRYMRGTYEINVPIVRKYYKGLVQREVRLTFVCKVSELEGEEELNAVCDERPTTNPDDVN